MENITINIKNLTSEVLDKLKDKFDENKTLSVILNGSAVNYDKQEMIQKVKAIDPGACFRNPHEIVFYHNNRGYLLTNGDTNQYTLRRRCIKWLKSAM